MPRTTRTASPEAPAPTVFSTLERQWWGHVQRTGPPSSLRERPSPAPSLMQSHARWSLRGEEMGRKKRKQKELGGSRGAWTGSTVQQCLGLRTLVTEQEEGVGADLQIRLQVGRSGLVCGLPFVTGPLNGSTASVCKPCAAWCQGCSGADAPFPPTKRRTPPQEPRGGPVFISDRRAASLGLCVRCLQCAFLWAAVLHTHFGVCGPASGTHRATGVQSHNTGRVQAQWPHSRSPAVDRPSGSRPVGASGDQGGAGSVCICRTTVFSQERPGPRNRSQALGPVPWSCRRGASRPAEHRCFRVTLLTQKCALQRGRLSNSAPSSRVSVGSGREGHRRR